MSNLLRAGIRRYIHSVIFWLAIAVVGVTAVIGSVNARKMYFDDFFCMIIFVAFAVTIAWLVGRENEEGIFRNKAVSGYTKGQIYVSELILGVGACLIMFLIFAGIFIAFNSYVFAKIDFGIIAGIFFDALFVNVCFGAILVTISCVVSKRVIVAIVNIILVFAIIFASYAAQRFIEQEEYFTEWEYEETAVSNEYGDGIELTPIPGSEHKVENPNYVDGALRVFLETVYNVFPYGHITEYISITNDWFGYEYYDNFTELDTTWEAAHGDIAVSADNVKEIGVNLIWSVIVNGAVIITGYILFRRKDLR